MVILQALSAYKVKSMDAFSPVSKKTSATFTTPDGKDMMACKGAPQVCVKFLHQPSVTCSYKSWSQNMLSGVGCVHAVTAVAAHAGCLYDSSSASFQSMFQGTMLQDLPFSWSRKVL